MAYDDARLVALYDEDNPDGPDHDFYRSLVDESSAVRVLDLGCGTGMLTVTVARPGRTVVGVDPSETMLAYARRRPSGDAVAWVRGDSSAIPPLAFDVAVMTGNVAQHITGDDWHRTLRDLRAALRDGGILAFESRNPLVRAWEDWTASERSTRETAEGSLEEWMATEEVAPGTVRIRASNRFVDSDETVTEEFDLAFRFRETITADLHAAGFTVDAVYGDWNRAPFEDRSPLMVLVAHTA